MNEQLVDPPAGWHWELRPSIHYSAGRSCALDLLLVENGRRTTVGGFYVADPAHPPFPSEPYYRRPVALGWQARSVSKAIVREWRRDDRLQQRFQRRTS